MNVLALMEAAKRKTKIHPKQDKKRLKEWLEVVKLTSISMISAKNHSLAMWVRV